MSDGAAKTIANAIFWGLFLNGCMQMGGHTVRVTIPEWAAAQQEGR